MKENKINTKKLPELKENHRSHMNIIPPNQILQDTGRNLRSRGLSPGKYNKFGKVKKRVDAPHYKKEFSTTHPYTDKTVSVTVIEDKTPIDQIKESFNKEVYNRLHTKISLIFK